MRPIKPTEAMTLIQSCRPTNLRDKALIDLMYHSGLRVSEALSLRKSDVDGNRITVRKGKGGKRRVVALTRTYGFFELHLKQCNDLLFTTRTGKPLKDSHVRRLLGKIGHGTHDLRRGHAVQLFELGQDLEAIRRQLGHSRISTTAIYLQELGCDLDHLASVEF